jgi:hypothetical protein
MIDKINMRFGTWESLIRDSPCFLKVSNIIKNLKNLFKELK